MKNKMKLGLFFYLIYSMCITNTYGMISKVTRSTPSYAASIKRLAGYRPSASYTTAAKQPPISTSKVYGSSSDITKSLQQNIPLVQEQLALKKPQQPSTLTRFIYRIFNIKTEGDKLTELSEKFQIKANGIRYKEGVALDVLDERIKKLYQDVQNQPRIKLESKYEEIQESIAKFVQEFGPRTEEISKAIQQNITTYVQEYDTLINEFIIGPNQEIDARGIQLFQQQDLILPYVVAIMRRLHEMVPGISSGITIEPFFAYFYPLIKKAILFNKDLSQYVQFEFYSQSLKKFANDSYKKLNDAGIKYTPEGVQSVKTISGKKRLDLYIFLDGLRLLNVTTPNANTPENKYIGDYINQLNQFANSKGQSDLEFMLEDSFTIDQLPPKLQQELSASVGKNFNIPEEL
ncbi:MAG TPA: hypothetical protein VGW78_05565 [Candidatus Babeliales bacterium]|jgi:hypothetical protein|nr:hypothetical protein [Candidatus Babeliales bacterium]